MIKRSDDTPVRFLLFFLTPFLLLKKPLSPIPLNCHFKAIFAKRLKSYHFENDPLLSHYSSSKVNLGGRQPSHNNNNVEVNKLVTLKGKTSDEIFPQLEAVVESRFPSLVRK